MYSRSAPILKERGSICVPTNLLGIEKTDAVLCKYLEPDVKELSIKLSKELVKFVSVSPIEPDIKFE